MNITTLVKCLAVCGILFALSFATAPTPSYHEGFQTVDSDTAIRLLTEGNSRFVAGESIHPHEAFSWRANLENEQHPWAVLLTCSDSRVPPELIFDQGFGDLFVIRVAGNIVDTDVIASIEYAVDYLDTQLVVVMGHTHCGAVTAAVDSEKHASHDPVEITSLVHRIQPAVNFVEGEDRNETIKRSVVNNVALSVKRLKEVADLQRALEQRDVKIVGSMYDMHTGIVTFDENQ
ncbi:carbonic anhydrase [Rhodopirellula sallentina]|uniref:Carbonic anhydrase n=1 Tax=Rhodopirellula sallentina SM41 TaxID=1263870 RepID=M5TT62_9BACT|nr:carbonic anhydrase [Rhodopirellula sallentina]EMI52350.1 Carbonic anhydrase [Rhodopirellula sallentina SM41]